jgi:hypothetical protein
MPKLALIAAAAIAAVVLAPRMSAAEHVEPPSRTFVQ